MPNWALSTKLDTNGSKFMRRPGNDQQNLSEFDLGTSGPFATHGTLEGSAPVFGMNISCYIHATGDCLATNKIIILCSSSESPEALPGCFSNLGQRQHPVRKRHALLKACSAKECQALSRTADSIRAACGARRSNKLASSKQSRGGAPARQ